jgi:hypothetical protein
MAWGERGESNVTSDAALLVKLPSPDARRRKKKDVRKTTGECISLWSIVASQPGC